MPSLLILTLFFLFLAVQVALYAIVASVRQAARRRRLTARFQPAEENDATRAKADGPLLPQEGNPPPAHSLTRLLPLTRLDNLLIAADVSMGLDRFLLVVLAAGACGFAPGYVLSRNLPIGLTVAAIAAFLPFLVLLHRRRKKNETMIRQLPEALDMIVRALRVGQSVDNALLEVSRSCPPPLGPEVRIVYEEVTLGLPFIGALRNFEARSAGLPDIKLMVTAFVIQHETGGNLSRILDNLADLIRKRDTLRRQVRALTAEGRSSALVLGFLPLVVGLFFWLVRPVYIQVLFVHPVGQKMLLLAILLEFFGFLVMRLLIRITP
ncbi:type II secretion system F family protein [Desulfobulbus elongatus]|uniref:type II secretion system F family protein n=1 Tax=Desulfobulbus elongatus TaxID=53332 RepID=UPI000684147E|nr:type II secretion system F family protein [Desulfobulbus elongatus]